MSEVRVLKKYPNRRLYDMQTSRYVTLQEVKEWVVLGTAIQVNESKTGKDLTRATLLQLLLEQEESDKPAFSSRMLVDLIRLNNSPLSHLASIYLEQSMHFLLVQQEMQKSSSFSELANDPLKGLKVLMEQNNLLFQSANIKTSGRNNKD